MKNKLTACALFAAATAASIAQTERYELDNGMRVILAPVEGLEGVGVETFYDVGFMDEPEPQFAHFIEHLVCYCETDGFAIDEVMTRFSAIGLANAETMPTLTHYDYAVPSEELDLVLQVESERLSGLVIDRDTVMREAPRCYAEVTGVESAPGAPVMKFAFMAAGHAWRTGADRVEVKAGLEEHSLEALTEYHRAHYYPGNLTLIVVGGFDAEETRLSIEELFDGPKRHGGPAMPPINYGGLPDVTQVAWDSKVSSVIVGFVPPEEPSERLALSLWGSVQAQMLMNDASLADVVTFPVMSGVTWPVGDLPFFFYASVRPGTDPMLAEEVMVESLESRVKNDNVNPMLLRQMSMQLTTDMPLTKQMVEMQARQLATMRGMQEDTAIQMVVANMALQLGLRSSLGDLSQETVDAALDHLSAENRSAFLERTLSAERRFITLLNSR